MEKINGFVLDIINETDEVQRVQLFKSENLPNGVKIKHRNSICEYQQLLSFAQLRGFIGSGIHADEELNFIICHGNTKEKYETRLLTDKEIEIDGFSNYVEVEIPANTTILFQLFPKF